MVTMKLILTADVDGLGGAGETVDVKDGYGRNLLLPKDLAIRATPGAQRQAATIRRAQRAKQVRDLDHANEIKAELERLSPITVPARSSEGSSRLFGSVTPADIVSAVRAAGGPALDKRSVETDGHIRSLGKHQVRARLHSDVAASFQLEVVRAG
jgi:large subunit ribosomal protein L9